jgi:hypothetical protein
MWILALDTIQHAARGRFHYRYSVLMNSRIRNGFVARVHENAQDTIPYAKQIQSSHAASAANTNTSTDVSLFTTTLVGVP